LLIVVVIRLQLGFEQICERMVMGTPAEAALFLRVNENEQFEPAVMPLEVAMTFDPSH